MKLRPAVVAVCLVVLLGATVPAVAYPGGSGGPPPPPPPAAPTNPPLTESTPPADGSPPPQPSDNPPTQTQVRTCSLYASESGYGLACRGVGGTATMTIREILAGDPLPDCWHEEVPADFVEPALPPGVKPGTKGTWYLLTCLTGGIDRQTLERTGPLTFSQEPVFVRDGDVITLTERQKWVVGPHRNAQQIPEPFVQTSPTASPRVGQDVAFYVPPSNTEGNAITVSGPGVGTVSMRSRMTSLTVYPNGAGGESVTCAGGGRQVAAGERRPEGVDQSTCWWDFDRSSLSQPDRVYGMHVTANWVVEYSSGGGWNTLGTFTKEQVTNLRVTEIQTVVVP